MTNLVKYEAACRALAECRAVDEVKDIRDKAEAMRIYGMQAKNKALEVDAAEIRIRAERRLGELIVAQKDTVGLNEGGRPAETPRDGRVVSPTLADVGISYDLSSRAQKLAAIPAAEFEAEVGEWRERVAKENERVTTRLQDAGERAVQKINGTPKPADGEVDRLRARVAELESQLAELQDNLTDATADNESMAKAFEADDKLASAMKELAKLRAENRTLKIRVNGLMNEKNEAIAKAKSWQRKAEARVH